MIKAKRFFNEEKQDFFTVQLRRTDCDNWPTSMDDDLTASTIQQLHWDRNERHAE